MKLVVSLFIVILPLGWGSILSAGELYVAFWNVENLFDTRDDPQVEGDEEFTPSGDKRWTSSRFNIKLKNLTRVIQDMNGGRGPDVLGLCEVENRSVVEALIARIKLSGRDYAVVHKDSPSGGGIDCAILYDRQRVGLKSSDFHFVDVDNTRDIVEAEFAVNKKRLFVFANHWPSRYNPKTTRIEAAQRLRRRIDEILKEDGAADVVVLGDLNDTPTDDSVQKHLKTWGDPESLHPGTLFNPMFQIHRQNRGTYVYNNKWEVIDHVILSPGLLDKQGLWWKRESAKVVVQRYQLFFPRELTLIPRPSRSYTSDDFHDTGYSDHLPVACVLEY